MSFKLLYACNCKTIDWCCSSLPCLPLWGLRGFINCLSSTVASCLCVYPCVCVCFRHVYFPPGRQNRTPADPYGLAYGSPSALPLYLQHTHAHTHRRKQTNMLEKECNVATRDTVAWCKQVDRTTRPALNTPALSGLSGCSEQNQTWVHTLSFSLFSFNRDETFHFISLIDSGRSITDFGSLRLSLQFDLCSCLFFLVLHNQWVRWTLMNLWQPCRHSNCC